MAPAHLDAAATAMALELLSRGEDVTLRARGASMWPFLLDGDVVTLTPCGRRPPRMGEVVLLRQGDFGLIHRVVAVVPAPGWPCQPRFAVKGDALPRLDGWFAPERLPARVARVRRGTETFVPLRALPLALSYLRGLDGR